MPHSFSKWVSNHVWIASGAFASAVFLLLGIGSIVPDAPAFRALYASRHWPTTDADITGTRLIQLVSTRLSRPEFTYRYAWDGRSYTTTGYALIEGYGTTSIMQGHLTEHPVGSRAKVPVN